MDTASSADVYCSRLLCFCWKCYVQADFLQDFGSIQEYRCPKCYVRIRLGDPELFDPLRLPDDDSDSISVCVSTTESQSRRSTITYSESEGGASDDVDLRPVTPDSLDQPSAPTNTPAAAAEGGDVPDAPPNIASAFADVTNFLLNVPTPRRRSQRFSFGGLSSISGGDAAVSPSKMIQNVMQAYKRFSVGGEDHEKPEEILNDRLGQSIEIRITQSPDDGKAFTRRVSATEIKLQSPGAGKDKD